MTKLLSLGLLLLLTLSTAMGLAWADEARIAASLDRNSVALNESATLQVVISSDGDVPEPQLPPLPQFTVQEAGRSQETTIVNGQMSNRLTLQYLIAPRQVGSYTVGPVTAQVEGRTVSSAPLELQVTAAPGVAPPATASSPSLQPPPPGLTHQGPAFVTAEVDNQTPYVGEVVTYRLRFYHTPGVALSGQAQYPNTTGFIARAAAPEKTCSTRIEGHTYQVSELSMTLLPTSPGPLEIGPARLQCRIPLTFQGLGDDDFAGLLSGADQRELSTTPVQLTVRPTPAQGRPGDFTGGVGKFTLEARVDQAEAKVGQPLTLELTVRGQGNLELVQAPPLPPVEGFKVLETVGGGVSPGADSCKFTLTLVPTQSGNLEVPAISMSTFDPATSRYETVTSTPLPITVAPGPLGSTNPEPSVDQRGLRPQHSVLSSSINLAQSPLFWALQAVPLLGIGAGWLLWRRLSVTARPRPGAALRRALAQLRLAPDLAGLPPILYGYLTEKLGESASGMTSTQLAEHLLAHGAGPAQVERFTGMLAHAERARYSPQSEPVGITAAEVEALLQDLERSLK